MDESLLLKILIPVLTSALVALGGWFIRQIVKYKKLIEHEEDSKLLNTLNSALDTQLEPIKQDIINLKKVETTFTTRLKPTQEEIEHMKDDIQEILNTINDHEKRITTTTEREKHLEHETRCAWRYRIRNLCHVYLRQGWMSNDDYNQLQEMFNIYEAIGGNGQTKELYNKTLDTVQILTDAQYAAMLEAQKESK